MVYVRSRKFCCCLPVRFGVFCESIIGIFISGVFAAASFILVYRFMHGLLDVSHEEKIALWAVGGTMTFFLLTSILGLIGAIMRQRNLVQYYAGFLTTVTLINIAVGVFGIWNLFHGAGASAINKCESSVHSDVKAVNSVTNFACNSAFKVTRIVAIVVLVIFWLIEIYGCVIAFDYVGQLEEEEDANMLRGGKSAGSTSNVTIVQAPPMAPYAFAGSQQSYKMA